MNLASTVLTLTLDGGLLVANAATRLLRVWSAWFGSGDVLRQRTCRTARVAQNDKGFQRVIKGAIKGGTG